ncbi:MAG: DUF448 domain-containing protein [Alphaproteobacteria bacterium]|nr:DUF448 domain-containing protein [Alphaproteobacteria bacterium]
MPERTCVVCRETTSPDDLVRLALAPDGTAVVDFRGRLPGRGAWVHPGCLAEVERKPGMLKRSLKVLVPAGSWVAQYRDSLDRAIRDGLSMAAAAGAVAGGNQVLTAAIAAGEVAEVALASDCSPRTERQLREAAPDGLPFTRLSIPTAELGHLVGRGPRAAVGIRGSRAATHVMRQLRRLRSLG